MKYITYDIWEIVDSDYLFFVTKLIDALCYLAHVFFSEMDSEYFKVLFDVSLA